MSKKNGENVTTVQAKFFGDLHILDVGIKSVEASMLHFHARICGMS